MNEKQRSTQKATILPLILRYNEENLHYLATAKHISKSNSVHPETSSSNLASRS